jgi:putative ABC transport system permease protein
MRMVVAEGLRVTIAGVAIGIPCAVGVGRLARSLLFGLEASDPVSLAVAAGFLTAAGIVAGALPGRRVASVDPLTALRCE